MNQLKKMFGLHLPLSVTFDAPPAAEANDPNAGGGNPDLAKGGSGGSDKGGDKDKKDTHEIEVCGEKRSVTLPELLKLAQKAAGADQRFEDAAKVRKDGEKGLRIASLIESLSGENASESDARELAALLGPTVNPDEFIKFLSEDDGTPEKGDKKPSTTKISQEDIAAALGIDPAEAKSILEFSRTRHIADAKKELRRIADEAVDKDEVFGKMIVGDKKTDRLSVIKDLVEEDVLARIREGTPYGPDLVVAAVQKVRSILTRFGIPGKPDTYPSVLGLGPGTGLPANVNADEPIKKISHADDPNEENLVARYVQKMIHEARKQ